MNKKANSAYGLGLAIIMVVAAMGLFGALNDNTPIIITTNSSIPCAQDCETYDAEFQHYKGQLFTSECWCKRKNEPLRIW